MVPGMRWDRLTFMALAGVAAFLRGIGLLLGDERPLFAPVFGMVGGIGAVAMANHERLKLRVDALERASRSARFAARSTKNRSASCKAAGVTRSPSPRISRAGVPRLTRAADNCRNICLRFWTVVGRTGAGASGSSGSGVRLWAR